VDKIEKYYFSYVFFISILGTCIAFYDVNFFESFYAREDSILEWQQFIALAAAAGLCFYRVYNLRREKNIFFLLVLLAMTGVFVFGAGEEISWGQRILNVKSPTYFIVNNSQQETNFHNLILGGIKINKLVFGKLLGVGIALYLLFLPWLYRKKVNIKNFCDRFGIPVPTWHQVIAYAALFLIVKITKLSGTGKKGEILEFGGTWIFFLMCWRPLNKKIFSK